MITRRGFLRGLMGSVGLAGLVMGYAGAVEPGMRLRVQPWRLRPPGWPRGWRLRIAVLADLHMGGPWMPLSRLRRVVAETNALEPDITVLLGDYIAGHRFVGTPVPVAETAAALTGLHAPLGVHAILGNHDWWDDRTAQRARSGPTLAHRALEAAGLPVMENSVRRIAHGTGHFWLAGLGDQLAFRPRAGHGWAGVDDLPGTLAQLPDEAPAILLAHEPDIFPEVPDRVCLTLSGHTHGGQVRLFGYSPVVPSRFGQRYAYGVVREGAREIVVSGGLGCSIVPVRLGVPPEITLVELR